MKNTPNYLNGKYKNEVPTELSVQNSFWPMLKEYIFGGQERFPREAPPVLKLNKESFTNVDNDGIRITWLGHSSTIIEMDGYVILTDPVFSKKVSPFPFFVPKRFHNNFPLEVEDLPAIDLVIISHNHYDHLDYSTVKAIHEKTERFCVPLGVGAYLEKWGVPSNKITELDWWENATVSAGFEVVATPARHFSGRGLFDSNKTLWASWVIKGRGHRVFFSGDSGYFPGFKEIGQKYGPIDVTMLEMAQYSEFWPQIHMMPEQSIQAHLDLQGKVMYPIHWGTFNLSIHEWTEPIERLLKAAAKHNVMVATPRVGESLMYGKKVPADRWWPKIKARRGCITCLKHKTT